MAIYNITSEMLKKDESKVDGEKDESYGGVEEPLDEAFGVDKEEDFSFDYFTIVDFYERVRSAMNIAESSLPNKTIDFPENAPLAELDVKAKIKEFEAMNEGKRLLYYSAVVYMTCYNLCSSALSKQITEQKTSNLTIKYSVNEIENPQKYFLDLVNDLIAKINEEEMTGFLGFAVTPSPEMCYCRKRRWVR